MHYRFLAALLLIVCVVPADAIGMQSVDGEGLDVGLFRNINNLQTKEDGWIEFIDQSSFAVFVGVPSGLLLYGVFADDRSVLDTGVLMGSSQAFVLGTAALGKIVLERQRPFEVLRDVKVKHLSSAIGSSFPSGHTSQAFAVATMLAYRAKPAVYVPALVWATVIGYGRIYLGLHYPTDVLGGIALGVIASSLVHAYRDDIIRFKDRVLGTTPEQIQSLNTPILRLQIPVSLH